MRIINEVQSVGFFSQWCGIMPFFLVNGDDLSISSAGQMYSYFLSTFLVVSSAIFCSDVLFKARYYKINESMKGDTEEINQTIETLFCVLSYTMIVISCMYNSPKHCRTFKDIGKIDEYLVANGFTGVYRCPWIVVLLGSASLVVLSVGFFYIHVQSDMDWTKQSILLIAYALQMILSCTFALYLRVLLINVTRRIAFVNQKLEDFAKGDIKENWRELSNLIELFCKFRYIIENLNSVTGVALLFYMGYAFYTVTNQSYLAFSTLTTHVEFKEKFDSMGLSLTWVLAEILIMAVICSSCDAMTSEANSTSQILARVYGKTKEYQNIIDKFLTKSIKQEVQFTAYGFFVIDNSTLFKIFSAVTTYLVILIQFKQLEDSKMQDQKAAEEMKQ